MAARHNGTSLIRQMRAVVVSGSATAHAAAAGSRSFASTSRLLAYNDSDGTNRPRTSSGPSITEDSRPPPRKIPEVAIDSNVSGTEVSEEMTQAAPDSGTAAAALQNSSTPSEKASTPSARGRLSPRSARKSSRAGGGGDGVPAIRFDDQALASFPPLLHRSHPTYDDADRIILPPRAGFKYGGTWTQYNGTRHRHVGLGSANATPLTLADEYTNDTASAVVDRVPMSKLDYDKLRIFTVDKRFVSQQTGKGKIQSCSVLSIVGNGKGLVGMANVKHLDQAEAARGSVQQAVKAMEFVERFENRTIHRSMVGKFSATQVFLRPRPAGFGLRVPPTIHAIARAAGISDLSANIIGSTHPINVTRAVLSVLASGAAPAAFGDGIGGRGRRVDKGQGAKTLQDLEIERGRRFRILSG